LGQVGGVFQAAFADGSVRNYPKLPNAKTIQALITRNGGEVIDD
jgi:prepilin-type processing-associated H-X9-DG protein